MASNGLVKIDYAAAESDINKINQAISFLNDSLGSLRVLNTTASAIQGETGSAIVEKSNQLTQEINEMIEFLNNSSSLIRTTINRYQEEDRRLALEQMQEG